VTASGQDISPRRVAVVGAGLAGLAAADALARAGCDVVVLEARERVGGRVWSRELDDGSVVEMGAEFILPGNTVVEATARRLNLGLWAKGMAYGRREPRGVPVREDELRAAAGAIARALEDPAIAAGTAAALLGRLDVADPVREAIRARVEISTAARAEDVGADELAGVAAISDAPSFGIAGGNHGLARALAAPLDVRLRSPVTAISRSGGVVVRAAGAELEADAVVVAVPAPVVAAIAFEPVLPSRLASALAGVRSGHAAKLFVPLGARPAPSAVLSVPERYWTWTARAGDAVQRVVHAFAGSRGALERLGVDAGPERWLASLGRLRDDLVLRPDGAVLSTWSDDPWARGAYSVHAPGGNDPALAERYGPLVLAGEYTAGPYAGLMEGALRSGHRAATQLVPPSGASSAAT
jgi:monoamine oxidase